jgi:hypothetical protein
MSEKLENPGFNLTIFNAGITAEWIDESVIISFNEIRVVLSKVSITKSKVIRRPARIYMA